VIKPKSFLEAIIKANISFVTGVPDSLLKDICGFIADNSNSFKHIIATNEGSALALAIGNYLATKKVPLVYMQNSGLGNIVNPVCSLADPQIYGIPIVLMIGWRGEIDLDGQQINDEPQHKKQGQITISQLEIMDIPYEIIDENIENVNQILKLAVEKAKKRNGAFAILVRRNTFEKYNYEKLNQSINFPLRENVIEEIISSIPKNSPVISTTGVCSRELFEIRNKLNLGHESDFLTVGGMGHASQIASGIAMAKPNRKVFCIDGDGAALMHTGAFAINADQKNLIHILINNEAHDSVGGQPTKGEKIDFSKIAREFGYQYCYRVDKIENMRFILEKGLIREGSLFIEVKCRLGFRDDLGRPTKTPEKNKNNFMNFLSNN